MEIDPVLEVGTEIGHLVLRQKLPDLGNQQQWLVECFCGAFAVWTYKRLKKTGHGKSKILCCACHVPQKSRGYSKQPEYLPWRAAYYRCTQKNAPFYKDYGGRGITVHSSWLPENDGFLQFLKDAGRRPSVEFSLDRIDNNGNYEPGNVRWATKNEQMDNRRITRTWWRDEVVEAVVGELGFWSSLFLFATTFVDEQTPEAFVSHVMSPSASFLLRRRLVGSHRHVAADKALGNLGIPWRGTARAPWNSKRGYKLYSKLRNRPATEHYLKFVNERYAPLLESA